MDVEVISSKLWSAIREGCDHGEVQTYRLSITEDEGLGDGQGFICSDRSAKVDVGEISVMELSLEKSVAVRLSLFE